MSIAKYSYPFTTTLSNHEIRTRERGRSLDRCERYNRSVSPFGSYSTGRSSSVIPKAIQYRDDREYSPETKPSPTRSEYYRATSCLPHKSNYETTGWPYQSTYDYYRTPVRDTSYSSARPYNYSSYISPYLSRTYSTPRDSYYYYLLNRPRNYSMYSYRTRQPLYYPYSYVPSVSRYPSLANRSYYTRYY